MRTETGVSGIKMCLCVVCMALIVGIAPIGNDAMAQDEVDSLFDMELDELLNLEVVTASKAPQKLSETPATVRVITARQIRERGYLTLEDVLSDLPGIQFRNIQGFNSYIFMRGVPNQNNLTLLMVDGIEINELNSGGFYGGGQFNLENIKQIEVVYGPSSALYGTNAMTGIINIITWEPKDEKAQGWRVGLTMGGFDTNIADISKGWYDPDQEMGFHLAGMFKQTSKGDFKNEQGDYNWTDRLDSNEKDISFDGKFTFHNMTFGFAYQDKQASRATNYKTIDADKLDYGTLWHITFMNLWLKHRYDFSEKIQLNSTVYYRDSTVEDDTVGYINKATATDPGKQAGYYRPNTQWGVEEQVNYAFSKTIDFIGGLAWEEETLSEGFSTTFSSSQYEDPPTPDEPDQVTEQTMSIYLQSRMAISKYVSVTLGLRWDDSTVYDKITTPRCGLVFNYDRLTGKLLYAEAYRAPKPWDYTYGTGNAGLGAEEVKSYEGSFSYQLTSNLKTDLSIFRNEYRDVFTLDSIQNHWINQGRLETQGIETALNYTTERWAAYFNYTYTDSTDDQNLMVDEISRHGANIGGTWVFGRGWKLNVRGNFSGERENPRTINTTGDATIDSAFIVNGDLAYTHIKNMEFHLIFKNLFDETVYHPSNRPPDRYRQPQRFILFKVYYAF